MKTNGKPADLAEIKATFDAAAGEMLGRIEAGRSSIQAKRDELRRLLTAPLAEADLRARAEAVVARDAERWLREHGFGLIGPKVARSGVHMTVGGAGEGSLARVQTPWSPAEAPPWGFMCVVEPEAAARWLVVAALAAGPALQKPLAPGAPLADRPRLVAEAEAAIAKLEADDERLTDEAQGLGLAIDHRKDVQNLRQRRAAHQAEHAEERAQLVKRSAAIDKRLAGLSRPAVSLED